MYLSKCMSDTFSIKSILKLNFIMVQERANALLIASVYNIFFDIEMETCVLLFPFTSIKQHTNEKKKLRCNM